MTSDAYPAAEARARVEIDRQLVACGWAVQSREEMNLYAGQGVAVREFIMAPGHGRADYLLFVDGKPVGAAVEARVAALRRSVLKAAFEGKLVPQNPSDEPASALLERIRAQRIAASTPRSRRSRTTA